MPAPVEGSEVAVGLVRPISRMELVAGRGVGARGRRCPSAGADHLIATDPDADLVNAWNALDGRTRIGEVAQGRPGLPGVVRISERPRRVREPQRGRRTGARKAAQGRAGLSWEAERREVDRSGGPGRRGNDGD